MKKVFRSGWLYLLAVSLLLPAALLGSIPNTAYAAGTTYYVSHSGGSDSNSGTSPSSPWKTLTKLSSVTFAAGDIILLKAGDTWSGDVFYPHGNGSSSDWITVSSYGTGAKPKILPGASSNWAIYLQSGNTAVGWKFMNLEIGNAKTGILYYNNTNGSHDGLWIEDCYFHDIKDGPVYPQTLLVPQLSMSTAIALIEQSDNVVSNVTVKNVTISDSDAPIQINGATNVTVDGLVSTNSYIQGALLANINGGLFKNSKILNSAYPNPMYWGTAALQLNVNTNVTVQDSEFAYTRKEGVADGVGVDFEGNNTDVALLRNYIHDNQGSAVLVYTNPDWGSDNIRSNFQNNIIANNGLENPETTPAFIRHYFNSANGGIISGNKVSRASDNQYLNSVDGAQTESWPGSYTVSGNTISTPGIAKKWVFNTDGDPQGWSLVNHLSGSVSGGSYNLTATGIDPYMHSPDHLGLSASTDKYVRIRLKNNTTSAAGMIFFTTTTDTVWDASKYVQFTLLPNSDYSEYQIDMSANSKWTGTIKQIRLDPTLNVPITGNTFNLDSLIISKNNYAKDWNFNTAGNLEGWTMQNDLNASVSGGALSLTATGIDPYMHSPDNLSVSALPHRYVKLRLENNTTSTGGKIFFLTTTDTGWDDAKSVQFTLMPNSGYKDYIVDMDSNPHWSGTIKQLRIDPTLNESITGSTFNLDYIRMSNF